MSCWQGFNQPMLLLAYCVFMNNCVTPLCRRLAGPARCAKAKSLNTGHARLNMRVASFTALRYLGLRRMRAQKDTSKDVVRRRCATVARPGLRRAGLCRLGAATRRPSTYMARVLPGRKQACNASAHASRRVVTARGSVGSRLDSPNSAGWTWPAEPCGVILTCCEVSR